jgi:hypothetical protein
MCSYTLCLTSVVDEYGWSMPRPGRLTHGKGQVPLYRRLGGSQGRCGQVRKNSLPPGFDRRTIQLVTIRNPGPTQVYDVIFILLICIQSDDCYFVAETFSCSLPIATVKLCNHGQYFFYYV